MQQDFDTDDFMTGGAGCPMHGDDAMVACPNCGAEYCQKCHPNSQFCPECARTETGEEDEEESGDETVESEETDAGLEEEEESLPEDVKADLESEDEFGAGKQAPVRPSVFKSSLAKPPRAARPPVKNVPSKPALKKKIAVKKVQRKPAARKPTKKTVRKKPASTRRPSKKSAKPKKPARKSRR